MDKYVLQMKGITKSFSNIKVLDNVHLDVCPGTVHALMGENGAGKSTLMKCLLGIYHMDSGEIILEGEKFIPNSVKHAREKGLSIIQQELSPVLERSVMENVWLGREPMHMGVFVDHKKMYQKTKELLEEYEFPIDPREKMSHLSVGKMQMVEIIKAVSWGAKVVMMDEPTSALTDKEVKHLFRIIERLKQDGVGVIYVSHKMDEIQQIADEITVLRDGKWISHYQMKEVQFGAVIHDMVGRELEEPVNKVSYKKENIVMEVQNLSDGAMFSDISFQLHEGEILGLAGMVGAGRTEVLETIFGLRKKTAGEILIHGKKEKIVNPSSAIGKGLAFITEERRKDGIISVLDLVENIMITNYRDFLNKARFIKKKEAEREVDRYMNALKVKASGRHERIGNLSGGNQQKVIIARWLLSDPQIMLMDEPTRGIDVAAKAEIYKIISDMAKQGKSILVVSSEIPELMRLCDRIMVMNQGQLTGILSDEEVNPDEIMRLSVMQMKE